MQIELSYFFIVTNEMRERKKDSVKNTELQSLTDGDIEKLTQKNEKHKEIYYRQKVLKAKRKRKSRKEKLREGDCKQRIEKEREMWRGDAETKKEI